MHYFLEIYRTKINIIFWIKSLSFALSSTFLLRSADFNLIQSIIFQNNLIIIFPIFSLSSIFLANQARRRWDLEFLVAFEALWLANREVSKMPEKSIASSVPNVHQDANLFGPKHPPATIINYFRPSLFESAIYISTQITAIIVDALTFPDWAKTLLIS